MITVLSCLTIFILYGFLEYQIHLHNLRKIPTRILVNGTRGKSSITRLIAAGLNAGDLVAFAKTTGSATRLIYPNGEEKNIARPGPATILEQMRVIHRVAKYKQDALVIECMAIRPHLLEISAQKIIKPQITVITRIGSDHLDTMGPDLKDAARAIAKTIPVHGVVLTSEKDFFDEFVKVARQKGSEIQQVDNNHLDFFSRIDDFDYYEHEENIIMALAVCQHFGIDKKLALAAMKKACPDPGALQKYDAIIGGKTVTFINAFAANDPDSIRKIVRQFQELSTEKPQVAFLINLRPDRPHRTKQLLSLLRHDLKGDLYFVAGEPQRLFVRMAIKSGIDRKAFIRIKKSSRESLISSIEKAGKDQMLLFGIGNIAGLGIELLKWLSDKGTKDNL